MYADGRAITGLSGPVIDLWDVNVDQHPFIDVQIQFDSPSQSGVSTPCFWIQYWVSSYISFDDINEYRNYNISNGVYLIINTTENPIFHFIQLKTSLEKIWCLYIP